MARIGILLTNVGTPAAPTTSAVRAYLNEFLSDPRIIALPQYLWQPILKGIILPFRSRASAKLYRQIWTEQGSPLLYIMEQLAEKLQQALQQRYSHHQFKVMVAMRYGEPSSSQALDQFTKFYGDELIILPLFPQYSATTTASIFDGIASALKQQRCLPPLTFINGYGENSAYIEAMAQRIKCYWQKQGKRAHLLFSFHGIPKAYVDAGDPYAKECHQSALLIAKQLNLVEGEWSMAFQSRFGPKEWLQPYCVDTLKQLPKIGITDVDVVCPGFAVDCLETLEEIARTNRDVFLEAGGKHYRYIPALNAQEEHVNCLRSILKKYLEPIELIKTPKETLKQHECLSDCKA